MNIQLVKNWRNFWKMTSVWFMALCAMAPDILNAAVDAGFVQSSGAPDLLSKTIKGLMLAGVIARLIQQQSVKIAAEEAADAAANPADPTK